MNLDRKNSIKHRMALANIPFNVVFIDSKKRSFIIEKMMIIQLLYIYGGLTQCEIAELLQTSQSAISKSMKHFRKFRQNEELWTQFSEKFKLYQLNYQKYSKS